ncbi:MAG: hypothetical protein ABI273_09260 [Lacunisphaera sp.]
MIDSATHARQDSWLQPSWKKLALAAAVAALGFLLPQEIPLVWYPLNNPGNDINYLEITCASNVNGEVKIYYDTGNGINELDSIRWPISPTTQTFTYTFPLPDAPITALHLDPISNGGTLTIRQMRIIDRRDREMRRFTREMFTPVAQIAAIMPITDGWTITSEPNATAPSAQIAMKAPILAKNINHRNFLRCLYSTTYLTLMLWILLLAVLFTFYRPSNWRDALRHLGFMAALAFLFSAVGSRGLIKNSLRYSRFILRSTSAGAAMEIDLRIDQPEVAQLFWDRGNGMVEAESLRQKYESHDALQTLRFPLPVGPLKGLRFDPLDGDSPLVVRGLRIVDAAERTLAVLPLNSLRPERQIVECSIVDDRLTIKPTKGARDPILSFTPSSVSKINDALRAGND